MSDNGKALVDLGRAADRMSDTAELLREGKVTAEQAADFLEVSAARYRATATGPSGEEEEVRHLPALGMSRGGGGGERLAQFASQDRLKPFVSNGLLEGIKKLLLFIKEAVRV